MNATPLQPCLVLTLCLRHNTFLRGIYPSDGSSVTEARAIRGCTPGGWCLESAGREPQRVCPMTRGLNDAGLGRDLKIGKKRAIQKNTLLKPRQSLFLPFHKNATVNATKAQAVMLPNAAAQSRLSRYRITNQMASGPIIAGQIRSPVGSCAETIRCCVCTMDPSLPYFESRAFSRSPVYYIALGLAHSRL